MKVIFLDIDGVLQLLGSDTEEFDEKSCKNLKRILTATGCKLVLTSSWRLYASYRAMLFEFLKPYSITRDDFIGKTKLLESRAKEIYSYLKKHTEIEDYIILDDEDMASPLIPQGKQFKTDPQKGITKSIADKCIQCFAN